MKVRWTALGVAIGLALALTVGFAFADSHASRVAVDHVGAPAASQTDGWEGMEAMMHDSAAMQEMHAQMPEELRAQCEARHEQMEQMMGADGMMGGMMGGDMSAHHTGTAGGGMTGSGSDGLGGMMGSGSSGMMGS